MLKPKFYRSLATQRKVSIDTLLAHAGCGVGVGTDELHGGLTPPIYMASTFERSPDLEYPKGFVYGRTGNPTRALFERTLATIEGGGDAAAFASGMAAISAIFQASPRAHVLLPDDVYHGTRTVLNTVFDGWLRLVEN
jgi:cystathionine gamma-synthase